MNDGPDVILIGGTDELYLDEEGRTFHVGDVMPRTLTHDKRLSLQRAGIRFATVHPEPKPARAPAAAPVQDAPAVEDGADKPSRSAKE